MKNQGKISSWNEERGFGFIKSNCTDEKMFVHISSFEEKRRKPTDGDIVIYEVGKDAKGRSQAVNVAFVIPEKRNESARFGAKFGLSRVELILILVIGIIGYLQYAPQVPFQHAELGSSTRDVSSGHSTQTESIGTDTSTQVPIQRTELGSSARDGSPSHSAQTDSIGISASISEYGGNKSDEAISGAFANRRSNIQVSGQGIVAKLLPDDNDGSQHQRFILRLASGQTLLVAHNIDIAPRINSLREGDKVEFYGQYEWNEKGGVIHWTHRDPRGSHEDGWLQYQGQKYQ